MNTQIKDIVWDLKGRLPELRKGGCGGVVAGKVVSVFGMRHPWGEMNTMYVHDPDADRWSRATDAPVGQAYVQGTELGRMFVSAGGRMGKKVHPRCFRLREANGAYQWTDLPNLNEARGWAPSVAIGEHVHVLGGSLGAHGPTIGSVECLDTADPDAKWVTVSKIPGLSRGWCGAAAARGKIYLIGGSHFFDPKPERGADRQRLKEVLEFDPQTREWRNRKPLPFALSGMDCCVYNDRHIIVVGGASATDEYTPQMKQRWQRDPDHSKYCCPFVLVYDPESDAWSLMPTKLPKPTNDIRVALLRKTLFAIGGENVDPATSNTTDWLRVGHIQG